MTMGRGYHSTSAKVAWVLVIIGAVNWGLVGLGHFFGGNWDVVDLILGNWTWLRDIVYILVGIGGVVAIFGCRCKNCTVQMGGGQPGGQM